MFLKDLAYFRAKCEDREVSVAIAFLDIDDFTSFNRNHLEPVVDRNVLPLFMHELEAHVYHHGYAYRQGGDEYLILLPSLSKPLAISFLNELHIKVAELKYPEIDDSTTVSIGLCMAEPGCPLTDRELLDRARVLRKSSPRTMAETVSRRSKVAIFPQKNCMSSKEIAIRLPVWG